MKKDEIILGTLVNIFPEVHIVPIDVNLKGLRYPYNSSADGRKATPVSEKRYVLWVGSAAEVL